MRRSNSQNIAHLQNFRQLDERYNSVIQKQFLATSNFISRLGLYGELEGHNGCVNCLEWSSDGRILASGSDDVQVILWDPFRKKQLVAIPTGHTGNIFTVKFLPNTENRTVISGAADYAVRIHDVETKDVLGICMCHTNRVKRCITDPVTPSLFWSAGEDGVIIQHDLRTTHNCPAPDTKKGRNILIDLRQFLGNKAEAKCLAINPVRTDYVAVGANDPFVRIYDRRMIKVGSSWQDDLGAVQYFVPGHLPSKISEYKRKYRSLAATYLTFSPDGEELLVNLGGEQIYLFPLVEHLKTSICNLIVPESKESLATSLLKEPSPPATNGYSNGYKNGTSYVATAHYDIFRGMRPMQRPTDKVLLPPLAEDIKVKANKAFEEKKFIKAVHLYNDGLQICSQSPVLYGNRAAALLKRAWDGDVYAALKDCQIALYLDPKHFKALIRMSRCLLELKRFQEAAECLRQFKARFPDHLRSEVFQALDRDLNRALIVEVATTQSASKAGSSTSNNNNSATSSSSTSGQTSSISADATATARTEVNPALRFLRSTDGDGPDSSDIADDEDSSVENEEMSIADVRSHSSDSNSSSAMTYTQNLKMMGPNKPEFFDLEIKLRDKAIDFRDRFCGHCNTTTDIKEANYFGNFIVAGSDDGSFYIWDRKTTNIVKSIKGDESIVNCLQPHPSTCMLATSGIESTVRLWSPMPEEGYVNDRAVDDVNDAAFANQKRMNSNPFEVILMNMGYRLSGAEENASDEDNPRDMPSQMPCNPS